MIDLFRLVVLAVIIYGLLRVLFALVALMGIRGQK